jgi:hypothetical protein
MAISSHPPGRSNRLGPPPNTHSSVDSPLLRATHLFEVDLGQRGEGQPGQVGHAGQVANQARPRLRHRQTAQLRQLAQDLPGAIGSDLQCLATC